MTALRRMHPELVKQAYVGSSDVLASERNEFRLFAGTLDIVCSGKMEFLPRVNAARYKCT